MSPIKKLIYSLLIGLLLSSICSFVLSNGLKKYYEVLNKKNENIFISNTKYDVLFVGSSRVQNNINPKQIDSVTNLKSFNAGTNGANLFESKTIIEGYLENHPAPSHIYLGIDLFSFNTKNKLFNYTNYLPVSKNNTIASVLNSLDHNANMYNYLPFLQMADYDDYAKTNAVKGFLSKKEIGENQNVYNGFISLGLETLDTNKLNVKTETVLIDTVGINALNEIKMICLKQNIKLKLFYAPEYKSMWQKKVTNTSAVFKLIDSISQKNNIEFLRYDTVDICNNPKYFSNVRHLNNEGAAVFSTLIATDIK